jgi:DNA-binding transcriptional LysR family regulator
LQEWSLDNVPADFEPRLVTALTCSNLEAMHTAAISGYGISYMPDFLVRDSLRAGALRTLLDDHVSARGQFWATVLAPEIPWIPRSCHQPRTSKAPALLWADRVQAGPER